MPVPGFPRQYVIVFFAIVLLILVVVLTITDSTFHKELHLDTFSQSPVFNAVSLVQKQQQTVNFWFDPTGLELTSTAFIGSMNAVCIFVHYKHGICKCLDKT